MTTEPALRNVELTPHSIIAAVRAHGWTLKSGAAVCGICGGFLAAGLGSVLTVIAWFTGAEWHGHLLQRDGTFLLFLTIPLLVFGAHCLDLLDKSTSSKSSRSK